MPLSLLQYTWRSENEKTMMYQFTRYRIAHNIFTSKIANTIKKYIIEQSSLRNSTFANPMSFAKDVVLALITTVYVC